MKKILLACSAGMSTSLLEKNMRDYISERGYQFEVEAHDSATAKNVVDKFDIILLGPQVRFMKDGFEKIANGKPVEVIPMQMYGLVRGNEVVELAIKLLDK